MHSRGIHHLDLVVSDVERSKRFYSELLLGLGWSGVLELQGERGGERGRARAASDFSCRAQLEKTVTLYESLIDTLER
jgi:catechol 2,3-dioxygenase-like lactoylglutathione lyase family enzyme